MADKISRADFIKRIRETLPALKDFTDEAILERVLAANPAIKDQVDIAKRPLPQEPSKEPTSYWGGFLKSLSSGEAAQTGFRGGAGFLQGAIADAPEGIYGALKLASKLHPLYAAVYPEDTTKEVTEAFEGLKNLPSRIWEAGKVSGSKPEEFGRVLGQVTGQPLVTAKAPIGSAVRTVGRPIQATGTALRVLPYVTRRMGIGGGIAAQGIGAKLQNIGESFRNYSGPQNIEELFKNPSPPPPQYARPPFWDAPLRSTPYGNVPVRPTESFMGNITPGPSFSGQPAPGAIFGPDNPIQVLRNNPPMGAPLNVPPGGGTSGINPLKSELSWLNEPPPTTPFHFPWENLPESPLKPMFPWEKPKFTWDNPNPPEFPESWNQFIDPSDLP